MTFHEMRDACRSNFNKYLERALGNIPMPKGVKIADLGCGTGVSALEIARLYDCILNGVDQDRESLDHFKQKLGDFPGPGRIVLIHSSVEKLMLPVREVDLVLVEGLFNLIGFDKGFGLASSLLGENGHMIIHDESADREAKLRFFESHGYEVLDSFILGHDVWGREYFGCLEKQLDRLKALGPGAKSNGIQSLLEAEIKYYIDSPDKCSSIYYILQKGNRIGGA